MATPIDEVEAFDAITELMQTNAGIADNTVAGHKMLVKLQEGLARINEAWGALVAGASPVTLAALEKFIIVEKYPGGSRKRRQSKKRKNHKNHNNNQ